jgi:hypothetical protein
MTRISARVKWEGFKLRVVWTDGVLSGDDTAVRLAAAADWAALAPPISPAFPTPMENPYAVPLVFEDVFDTVVSIVGAPTLPPGDLLMDEHTPPRRQQRRRRLRRSSRQGPRGPFPLEVEDV